MGVIICQVVDMIDCGADEDDVRLALEVEYGIWQPEIREEVIEQALEHSINGEKES